MMSKKKNKDGKIAGIIGSILVHLLLLLALMFYGLNAFIPETGEEGLTVNYGTSDMGDGLFEPAPQEAIEDQLEPAPQPEPAPATPPVTEATTAPSQSDLQTQDIEESLEMKEARKKEELPKEEEEVPKEEEEVQKNAQEEVKNKASSAAQNAFANKNKEPNTSSASEGLTSTAANQGNPLGDVASTNHNGGGTGVGISHNLKGRSILGTAPEPSYKPEEGVIVVEIELNADGTVKSAKAGVKGTTILNVAMRKAAEDAAKKAIFNPISGNTTQSGTITYNYVPKKDQ